MNMKSIEDVFNHLLSDTYSAEKQLTRGLAKLARAASSEQLSAAFKAHLEETQGQIERIDQIVEHEPDIKIKRMKCVAMEGPFEEAIEVILEAIAKAGYKPGIDISLALDVASSEMFRKEKNVYVSLKQLIIL